MAQESGTRGLPTSQGIEHISITVGDLDEATDFFAAVFGCRTMYTMGPFEGRKGPFIRVIANQDVRSVVHHVRVMRSPSLNVEMFEVTTPRQNRVWPDLLDIGGWSLTAVVTDLAEAAGFLEDRDLYHLGEGHYMTPFGLHFELVPGSLPEPPWRPAAGTLPGFKGFERIKVTVADLDEASALLERVFGFESEGDVPVWRSGGPDGGLRAFANVDARARPSRGRAFRSGHLGVELIECPPYPGQNRVWPGMFDVGGWHLAFYVDDVDAAFDFLTAQDVHVLGRKKPAYLYEAGPGSYTVHGLAPFGFCFELVSFPHGRDMAAEYTTPAWHPAHPGG